MARPCDVLKKADVTKRILTFDLTSDYGEAAFVSFEDPKHCTLCARAIKIWKSDKKHTEVRGRKKWTSLGT